ncbi:MAG: hypothetical protein Q4G68_05910 [Planctomycetia bacterium]|nr:hypothetical protein [Planctomycetia bacterium]
MRFPVTKPVGTDSERAKSTEHAGTSGTFGYRLRDEKSEKGDDLPPQEGPCGGLPCSGVSSHETERVTDPKKT